jgi:cytochrome c-type biogenesis protein CcmH/NrfG
MIPSDCDPENPEHWALLHRAKAAIRRIDDAERTYLRAIGAIRPYERGSRAEIEAALSHVRAVRGY